MNNSRIWSLYVTVSFRRKGAVRQVGEKGLQDIIGSFDQFSSSEVMYEASSILAWGIAHH